MGRAVFPPCCLTWGQTMVEVMKIMVTSFKRCHASTAAFSEPNPAAGHHQSMPLPETPRHSWASPGQSLVGSLLLSPGSWCTQGFVCALQESVSQSWVSSGGSMVGLMVTSSKRAYAIPGSTVPRAPAPEEHSFGSVSVGSLGQETPQSTRFVWALWASLLGIRFDSKCDFAPPTILLELLLCPWMWVIFFGDPTFFCWWLFSSEL